MLLSASPPLRFFFTFNYIRFLHNICLLKGIVSPCVFSLLLASTPLFSSELKELKPHFEAQTIKTYVGGAPRIIRYSDEGVTVKELEFSSTGDLVRESDLKENVLHGPTLYFTPSRTLESVCHYENGVLAGTWKDFYPDGQVKSHYTFNEGKKNGAYTQYFESGEVLEKGTYQNGLRGGLREKFSKIQKPILQCKYVNGLLDGEYQEWDSEGNLRISAHYFKGLLHGSRNQPAYQKNKETADYRFGMPVGPVEENLTRYYSDGTISYQREGDLVTEYDQNGVKRLEYSASGNGPYQEWDAKGNLNQRLHFKNDNLDGVQEAFFPTKIFANFTDGACATYSEWDPKGRLKVEMSQQGHKEWNEAGLLVWEEKPNGTVREWYSNGQLKTLLTYDERGMLHGPSESYTAGGIPLEKCVYQNGAPVGTSIFFHKEPPYRLAKKLFHVDGKLEGEQFRYYENGNLESCLTYKNGVLDGTKKLFSEDGCLLEGARCCDGLLHGPYYLKRENGTETITQYDHNKLEGLYQVFYPETLGRIKALESNYSKGLLDGEFAQFNEAGTKVLDAFYIKGKREGLFTLYSPKGQVIFAAEFKNDLQHGITREYYPSGTLFKEASFKNDLKTGEERTYFENGALKASIHFQDGVPHGLAKEWNQADILIYEAEMENGLLHGRLAKYDDNGTLTLEKNIDGLLEMRK